MVMTEMSLQTAVGAFVVMSAAGAVVSAREACGARFWAGSRPSRRP